MSTFFLRRNIFTFSYRGSVDAWLHFIEYENACSIDPLWVYDHISMLGLALKLIWVLLLVFYTLVPLQSFDANIWKRHAGFLADVVCNFLTLYFLYATAGTSSVEEKCYASSPEWSKRVLHELIPWVWPKFAKLEILMCSLRMCIFAPLVIKSLEVDDWN